MMHARLETPGAQPLNQRQRVRALAGERDHWRRACARLEQANARLANSNRELTQFAYVASHDLQEPLRMVDSYLGLIERRYKGKLDADGDAFIGFAVDGARRMKRLIEDLLTYSRVSNCALEVKPTDVGAVVETVRATLAAQIAGARATIEVGPLPVLDADPVQLERLFTNLVGNALKFHGGRPPRVAIFATRRGACWEFAVADNGIGIAPEFREKVFEIFARLHTRDRYPGSGIGLAACKRIVELHGGTIRAAGARGGGCVIRFTLPAAPQPEEPLQ